MSNRGLAISVIIVLGYSCAGDDRPPSAQSTVVPEPTTSSTYAGSPAPSTANRVDHAASDSATTGRTTQADPGTRTTRGSNATSSTTTSSTTTPPSEVAPATDRIHTPYVTFELPPGWQRGPTAVATQFATGSDCVAATVVDFEPPTDPAADVGAGFTLRSTVQVCARPIDDDTLIGFLTATYGDSTSFEPVEIGGVEAYRSTTGLETVTFVQTDSYRLQVLTNVAAERTLERERSSQVGDIVASMRFV